MPTSTKKTLRGPGGLMLVLDREQVIPEDPGAGTPALVVAPFGRGTSTYWCAADNGEVDGPNGFTALTRRQCDWLNSTEVANEVDQFLYGKGA